MKLTQTTLAEQNPVAYYYAPYIPLMFTVRTTGAEFDTNWEHDPQSFDTISEKARDSIDKLIIDHIQLVNDIDVYPSPSNVLYETLNFNTTLDTIPFEEFNASSLTHRERSYKSAIIAHHHQQEERRVFYTDVVDCSTDYVKTMLDQLRSNMNLNLIHTNSDSHSKESSNFVVDNDVKFMYPAHQVYTTTSFDTCNDTETSAIKQLWYSPTGIDREVLTTEDGNIEEQFEDFTTVPISELSVGDRFTIKHLDCMVLNRTDDVLYFYVYNGAWDGTVNVHTGEGTCDVPGGLYASARAKNPELTYEQFTYRKFGTTAEIKRIPV